ncbi:MAG: hypothetical protein KDD36_02115 [Flavobacteriales bacterium]|nr:hypothetical protein [Flavobacteriales bacterium]
MKRIWISVLACTGLFSGDLLGQEIGKDDLTILYRNEMNGGPVFHSQGWGLTFKRGIHITGSKKRLFEVEYVGLKHPKEVKSVNPFFDNTKSYIYGKVNTLSMLRLGYGMQYVIAGKDGLNGVEIRFLHYTGATFGLAKPVYLEILKPTSEPFEFNISTERYQPLIHFPDNIYGRAPFTKGLGQLAVHPGLYAKTGLAFEYGPLQEEVKAIEVGVALDVYPKDVHIMAAEFVPSRNYFLTFYLSLLYGKKW